MTDYRVSKNNNKEFKRRTNRWQGVLAIFVVSFFVIVLIGSTLKTLLAKNNIKASGWDNVSSFVLGLANNQNSIFILQKDPKRAVFIRTGIIGSGVDKVEFFKKASVAFGTDVKNYVDLGNLNDTEIKKKFDGFISLVTPIKILTLGGVGGAMNTNVSRMDALKLWWQLKAIRSKDLQFVNMAAFGGLEQGKSDDKVLGITSDYLNREISKYLENTEIIQEDVDLKIVNSSGDGRSSYLAESFISTEGGRVVSAIGDTLIRNKCNIITNEKSSYTVRHLAKIFVCDINDAPQTDDKPSATIYLGQDFPARYY